MKERPYLFERSSADGSVVIWLAPGRLAQGRRSEAPQHDDLPEPEVTPFPAAAKAAIILGGAALSWAALIGLGAMALRALG